MFLIIKAGFSRVCFDNELDMRAAFIICVFLVLHVCSFTNLACLSTHIEVVGIAHTQRRLKV